eukprot:gene3136-3338_t
MKVNTFARAFHFLCVLVLIKAFKPGFLIRRSCGLRSSSWDLKIISTTRVRSKINSSNQGKSCTICGGSKIQKCPICQGSGRDMKNGDPFQRMMCNRCKGLGAVPCQCSTSKGLSPEQRDER